MRFLLYISKKYSIPIVTPLVDYLLTTEHQCALFLSAKVSKSCPDAWHSLPRFSTVQDARKFQPDFVLAPGNFVDFRIPGRKVQIFHGLGVEKDSHYKIRHFFDCYCTSGPYVTARFRELQRKHRYFAVIETGWPKVDYILNYPTENLKQKLNLPEDKKIILYAPTFSTKLESATDLLSTIPAIQRDDELWLVKFHELMNKEVVAEFARTCGDTLRIITDYDITPWLHVADVMLSDTSSVIYECMLLNKPVVTYRTRSRSDKGIDITHPEQLRPALDETIAYPQAQAQQRAHHIAEINPDCSGTISQKLIQRLVQMARDDAFPKHRKPLNLFRKMQILYHERFRKGYLR
jgi:CDP-glycerol glycerophosphotransferase (TagB/SpsB family)